MPKRNMPPDSAPRFPEHLGDIGTDALLRNINNYNPHVNPMEDIRAASPQGFVITAVFEHTAAGDKHFVRLVLEPKEVEA